MGVRVRVSSMLRQFTDGQEVVEVTGRSPIECVRDLRNRFPGVRRWLYDKQGQLRPQVRFFANGQMIGTDELTKPLDDGDELFVLLAIGGG